MNDKQTLDNLCALRERIQREGGWDEAYSGMLYETAKTLGFDNLDAAFIAGDWPALYAEVEKLRANADGEAWQPIPSDFGGWAPNHTGYKWRSADHGEAFDIWTPNGEIHRFDLLAWRICWKGKRQR